MEWYYSENGERRGPTSEGELRALIDQGNVTANDLVWRDGLADWTPVSQTSEFSGSGTSASGPAAASTPVSSPYSPPQAASQPNYAAGGYHQPQAYQAQPSTSGLAIAALVCGIIGICTILSAIPAIICGHLALKQIDESGGTVGGRGLGIAGLILGYSGLVLNIVGIIILVASGGF